MKVGITTALSIAGVLAAGAAAFAVNTSVLTSSSSETTADIASNNSMTTTDLAEPVTGSKVKEASVSSTPVSEKVTTYQVGTSGSVVIDTTSGSIVVTNVIPAAGWTSEPAHTEPNGDVKVHFISGATRIEFIAQYVNGLVTIEARSESAPPNGATISNGSASSVKPSFTDDDEEEDHQDRDHDERHENDADRDDD